MINRAKCKLCSSIIESHLPDEIIYCKCGEIAVCDGPAMRMYAARLENFLRVDDLGHEIKVSYEQKSAEGQQHKDGDECRHRPTKDELIDSVEYAIKALEDLPSHHVTSKDLANCMLMLINILKRE